MSEIEFVNREYAEAEAARAIRLLNDSDEAKVEAWFALQAVADEIGPNSNVGVRGIMWDPRHGSGRVPAYRLSARCELGRLQTATAAPPTLAEAVESSRLAAAKDVLERKIRELGGLSRPHQRPKGYGNALLSAVVATPEGEAWAGASKDPVKALQVMVRVADAYGREGVFPPASAATHYTFARFDARAVLVREFPTLLEARAKAMSLRGETPEDAESISVQRAVPRAHVNRVARMAGVSRPEARAILRAMLNGRSKRQLVRAVNLAAEVVEAQTDPRDSLTTLAA